MPKLSTASIVTLTRTPHFFESFQFIFGSYSQAGKRLKLDPKILSDLASMSRPQNYDASDKRLKSLKKALGKMSPGDYRAARYFPDASETLTPGQLEYARRYSKKGPKGRAYFKKAIKDYHDEKTKRVLMPGIRIVKGQEQVFLPDSPKTRARLLANAGRRTVRFKRGKAVKVARRRLRK
jgi:hypothetical protein